MEDTSLNRRQVVQGLAASGVGMLLSFPARAQSKPLKAVRIVALSSLKKDFDHFIFDILGLREETTGEVDHTVEGLMQLVLDVRAQARSRKDWATSDKIRDVLAEVGIQVKDGKEGVTWARN